MTIEVVDTSSIKRTVFTSSEVTGAFASGKSVYVDSVYGSDATGLRQRADRPFLTIEAALAAASSGDAVLVGPGIYVPATTLTIPANVALIGVASNVTAIQKLLVTANTTLLSMGDYSRLENFAINLTSAGHYTLKGTEFPGNTPLTAKIRSCNFTVDNSGAGAGASEVYGIHYSGTGSPTYEVIQIRACNVTVKSTGTGKKRGLLSDTGVSRAHLREFNALCTGGSDSIGVEVNKAGSYVCFLTGVAEGSTADISCASVSTLELGSVELETPSANGLNFTAQTSSGVLIWSESGGLVANATRFMRIAGTTSITEVKMALPKKGIIQSLHIRAVTGPGGARTAVFTIRKNGVDTALTATLVGAAVEVADEVNSVGFLHDDDISLMVVTQVADATSDVHADVQYV